MANSWREYQFYIYVILFAIGVVFLIITINDFVTKNEGIIKAGLTITSTGDWEYWIFALALILSTTFLYLSVKVASNTKRFEELIRGESKSAIVKNLKELQRLARELGPRHGEELQKTMDKWKIK